MVNIKEIAKKYGRPEEEFHYRATGLIEWVCDHGVGHPVPESAQEVWKRANPEEFAKYNGDDDENPWFIHGCDGCCKWLYEKHEELKNETC